MISDIPKKDSFVDLFIHLELRKEGCMKVGESQRVGNLYDWITG